MQPLPREPSSPTRQWRVLPPPRPPPLSPQQQQQQQPWHPTWVTASKSPSRELRGSSGSEAGPEAGAEAGQIPSGGKREDAEPGERDKQESLGKASVHGGVFSRGAAASSGQPPQSLRAPSDSLDEAVQNGQVAAGEEEGTEGEGDEEEGYASALSGSSPYQSVRSDSDAFVLGSWASLAGPLPAQHGEQAEQGGQTQLVGQAQPGEEPQQSEEVQPADQAQHGHSSMLGQLLGPGQPGGQNKLAPAASAPARTLEAQGLTSGQPGLGPAASAPAAALDGGNSGSQAEPAPVASAHAAAVPKGEAKPGPQHKQAVTVSGPTAKPAGMWWLGGQSMLAPAVSAPPRALSDEAKPIGEQKLAPAASAPALPGQHEVTATAPAAAAAPPTRQPVTVARVAGKEPRSRGEGTGHPGEGSAGPAVQASAASTAGTTSVPAASTTQQDQPQASRLAAPKNVAYAQGKASLEAQPKLSGAAQAAAAVAAAKAAAPEAAVHADEAPVMGAKPAEAARTAKEEAGEAAGPPVATAAAGATPVKVEPEARPGVTAALPTPPTAAVGSHLLVEGEAVAAGASPRPSESELPLLHRQHDIPPHLREAAIAVLSKSPTASPRASGALALPDPRSSPRGREHAPRGGPAGQFGVGSPPPGRKARVSSPPRHPFPSVSPPRSPVSVQREPSLAPFVAAASSGQGREAADRREAAMLSGGSSSSGGSGGSPTAAAVGPSRATTSTLSPEIEAEEGGVPGLASGAQQERGRAQHAQQAKQKRDSSWEEEGAYSHPPSPQHQPAGSLLPGPPAVAGGLLGASTVWAVAGEEEQQLSVAQLAARRRAQQQGRKPQQQGAAGAATTKGEVVAVAVPWEAGQTGHLGQEVAGGRLAPTFPGRFVFHDEEVGLYVRSEEAALHQPLLQGSELSDESEEETVAQRAQHGLGFWPSTALVAKSALGVGIVVLPFAFSRLGLAGGSIALGVAGLLAFLSAHLLLKASHAAGVASYGDAVGAVLGGFGGGLADLAMAALCFGLLVASFWVSQDALVGGKGALLAKWLDKPTAAAAYAIVVVAPLVSARRPRSLAGAAAVGVAAAALWAALLGALAVSAFVRGELPGGIRFWPKVGGKPWWQAVMEVWGVVPVLLLAAAPHSYLSEALTVKNGRRVSRARKEGAFSAALLLSWGALLLVGFAGYALFGDGAQVDITLAWDPTSFEGMLGTQLAALCCAVARLAVLLALLTGMPLLMAGFRTAFWRLLFWQELKGAGFFIVTYTSLAGAAYAALRLSDFGGKEGSSDAGDLLWQGLQLLGATAGAAVVLLIPGLAFCCGRRRERGGVQLVTASDRLLGSLMVLAGLGVAAGAAGLLLEP
ncbi:hypothetical protein N2152v2_008530 [Parachlorella kessleri]